ILHFIEAHIAVARKRVVRPAHFSRPSFDAVDRPARIARPARRSQKPLQGTAHEGQRLRNLARQPHDLVVTRHLTVWPPPARTRFLVGFPKEFDEGLIGEWKPEKLEMPRFVP